MQVGGACYKMRAGRSGHWYIIYQPPPSIDEMDVDVILSPQKEDKVSEDEADAPSAPPLYPQLPPIDSALQEPATPTQTPRSKSDINLQRVCA